MRSAAEKLLAGAVNFTSQPGTAEATGLPDASVDLVTAAQAFHWFVVPACRREFARILRPGGLVALVWNERLADATPFLAGYEALLKRHATDYEQLNHANLDEAALAAFYAPAGMTTWAFPNAQVFDLAGLQGRLLSSSYAPNAGQPGHEAMMAELHELHTHHQQDGRVTFLYSTKVYLGRVEG
jgi:SAM-dependent methyltransferase